MKGILEPQVIAGKNHTTPRTNFNKTIYLSSAQMYLHNAPGGIFRLQKNNNLLCEPFLFVPW